MAFYRAVQSTIDRLADFPESGPLTGYNHPKIRGSRFVPIEGFEKTLVFYKPSAGSSPQRKARLTG